MTTYTNLGITEIVTGDEAGTWGDTTNANFGFFDTAICGIGNIVAPATGTTSVPNNLPITDAAVSVGRNRVLNFTSASDLLTTVYYQITPDNFTGYYFVQNNLMGSRDLTIFQGTYNAGRALTISGGQDAVIMCDGLGAGLSTVTSVLSDMTFNSLNVTAAPTSGNSVMNQTAVTAAITTAGSSGITFLQYDQILFRGAAFPAGWAISAAPANSALRIVGGAASAPSSGGSVAFTTAFNGTTITGSTTLTSAQSGVGAHTHPYNYGVSQFTGLPNGNPATGNWTIVATSANTGTAGASGAASGHTHPLNSNAVLYYDMQVIQKS